MRRLPFAATALLLSILTGAGPLAAQRACAAGQTSATFRVVADVFTTANPSLAVQSYGAKASVSVGQRAIAGRHGALTTDASVGYPATTDGFDTDADGIPDGLDADADGDGLPSSDEGPFGTSAYLANSDGDPHDDRAEWIAGTDGANAASFLEIADVQKGTGDRVTIVWEGVGGRTYRVLSGTNLVAVSSWGSFCETNVTAPGLVSLTHTNAAISRGYYRINVSRNP